MARNGRKSSQGNLSRAARNAAQQQSDLMRSPSMRNAAEVCVCARAYVRACVCQCVSLRAYVRACVCQRRAAAIHTYTGHALQSAPNAVKSRFHDDYTVHPRGLVELESSSAVCEFVCVCVCVCVYICMCVSLLYISLSPSLSLSRSLRVRRVRAYVVQ